MNREVAHKRFKLTLRHKANPKFCQVAARRVTRQNVFRRWKFLSKAVNSRRNIGDKSVVNSWHFSLTFVASLCH